MIMRQELERAMNTFAALEQQSIESARPSRSIKPKEAEAKIEAPKEGEAKIDSMKTKETEQKIDTVKAKESEGKVDSLKAKESEELSLQQQPTRRDVFSPWGRSPFDEFFGDISPFGYRHRNIFDQFNAMERYAEDMRADMDRHFKMAEEKQEYPELPENTSYFMRMETNDNGNVKVKTMKKVPGTDWVTKFEEYKNGRSAIEKDAASETKQAIENKEKPVEIADETPSKSASLSA